MIPLYDLNPHRRIPWLTVLIIGANLVATIWLYQLPGTAPDQLDRLEVIARYGFVPERMRQLSDPNLVVKVRFPVAQAPAARGGQPVAFKTISLPAHRGQIVASMFTMMFLHGGWLHLVGNMWFLWLFGNNIEDRLGHVIFGVFYVLGGLLALACHWIAEPASTLPVIGASGAVAAVLGAYAITFPAAKVRTLIFIGIVMLVDLPALLVLGVWFFVQMMQGLGALQGGMHNSVAWWAHIGGFVAGIGLMPLLALGAPPPGEDWQKDIDELFRVDR